MRLSLLFMAFGGSLVQSSLVPSWSVGGVTPDLPLILTALVALRRGPEAGCLVGFAAGLLQDARGLRDGPLARKAVGRPPAGADPGPHAPGRRGRLPAFRASPALPFPSLTVRAPRPCDPPTGPLQRICRRGLRARRRSRAHAEQKTHVDLVDESTAGQEAWRRRVVSLAAVVAVAVVGLVGQIWYLQVLEGVKLQELSEKNRIRIRPVAAPRGILFDRNGLALVDNRPAFTLSLIPREMEDRDTVLARLSILLKIPIGELQDSLDRVPPDSIRAIRVRRGLSLEDVT